MIRRTLAMLAVVCASVAPLSAQCPTAAPATPQSPTGNISNANSSVTFSWTPSSTSGVSGYDVLVGQGTTASRTVVCSGSSTANSCTVASGFAAGGYNWLVRTKIGACNIDSAVKTFTVHCSNTPPVNQSPSDGAANVSTTPTLQWNAVSGASGYEVFFGVAGTAGAACSGQPITTVTTNSATTPQLQAGTSYEWKVESIFANGCPGTISACTKFTTATAACNPAGAFSPLSPANGALVTTDKPTLQWSASSGADKYFIHIGLQNPPTPQTSPQVSGSNTNYTVNTSLAQGIYYWYVDAFPTCGTAGKTSSSVSHFTVSTCPTAATTLTSPANGAANVTSPVTFKWTSLNNTSGYNLYVQDELVTTTTATQATVVEPSGTALTWYVEALYKNCNSVRSATSAFTTASPTACPTGSITLTAPANGASLSGNSKVAFSWSPISGATAYRLFVSMDGASPAQFARTSNPNATVALPSGSADWYVEALFNSSTAANSCPSIVSSHGTFTVTSASTCSTHTPVTLASPISGSATSPVTFNWTATDQTATLYRVWISADGDSFDDIGVTTNTQLKSVVEPGPVVWYVQSFFEGCPSVNSSNATFTATSSTPRCPTAAPTLIAPVGNVSIQAPVTFVWTAVVGVDDYRLFASKDGGDFVILDDDLDDPTATHNLPPGNYTWFVEATFDECPSTRSTRSKFTVNLGTNCPTTGPALIAPADGSLTVTSPVTFDWSDVAGATGYSLVAKHNDGSPTKLAEPTVSEATKHLADGSYEWWVVAFFSGCPSTESAHHTFVIPPSTCDMRGPLLLHLPPDGISVVSPVRFTWSNVRNATQYKVWASIDGGPFSVLGRSTNNALTATVPSGAVRWYVEAVPPLTSCAVVNSTQNSFTSLAAQPPCATPTRPQATAIGQVASGTPYSVRWAAILNTDHYELQESTSTDFSKAPTQEVNDTSADFNHTATAGPVPYYYRVRAVSSCDDSHSVYSKVVTVYIVDTQKTSVEYGISSKTTQIVNLPGQTPTTTFSVQADQPWVTVSPSSGTIGPAGVALTVTSDPGSLDLGTNTATLLITYGASGKTVTNGVSSGTVPVSINLVTPISPTGKNTPLPTSLIIPAVAHAAGANSSLFQSDVRIANVSATTQKYQLNFTYSGTDGTQSGQSTIIQVDPGVQMALNDILTSFFGGGDNGSGIAGVLEIRPLTNTSTGSSFTSNTPVSVQTVAASKTYDVTSNGTFGQFIPAIPFSQFISNTGSGAAQSFISLQQIAQSSAFRTNLGILEAAGEPASVMIHVYDNSGNQLAQIPLSLQPSEQTQINSFLAVNNLNVTDGRIEVEVTSTTGKVSAYASVVDNQTNDPLLVFPVLKGAATATRYTIPGVADLNNGFASWRSDIRVFNPTSAPADATLTYYPQGDATVPPPQTVTVNPGQVVAIDNALQTLYGVTNSGGAIVVSTPSTSALTVTARTYNQTGAGTYGQFIPAVSPAQSVGLGDRTLQVLQLESSSAYRTNIGIVETSGNPVTVQVTVLPEDSKVSANLTYDLNPNEFRQFSIGDFGFGTMYNARVSVKVIGGTGRVTAYGSVIDQITQDPTYVPAQ